MEDGLMPVKFSEFSLNNVSPLAGTFDLEAPIGKKTRIWDMPLQPGASYKWSAVADDAPSARLIISTKDGDKLIIDPGASVTYKASLLPSYITTFRVEFSDYTAKMSVESQFEISAKPAGNRARKRK